MKCYVASQVAAEKADGMLAPLLQSYDDCESERNSDVDSSSTSEVETVKQSPTQVLKSLIVYLVLAAGVAISVAAIVVSPSLATYILGGLLIATAPHSAIKERQLGKIPTLRSMINKMSEEVENLKEQVDVLSQEIDMLKPEADRVAAVEEELRAIAEKQSFNFNRLVDLVKENESVLAQMKINLRQRICQDMIRIVTKSDKNNDQIINEKEAYLLAFRLRLQLHEYGVEFNSEKFLRYIGSNFSTAKLIRIARMILQPDHIRDAKEDLTEIYDMFYVTNQDLKTAVVGGKCSPSAKSGNHSNPSGRVSLMS